MWAMSAVKRSEVLVNGPEDRQQPGHVAQLTERRNHVVKKQLPPTEGRKGKLFFFSSREP